MIFMLNNAQNIPDYFTITRRSVDWHCKTGIFILERCTFVEHLLIVP
jgi:hypothetical protein